MTTNPNTTERDPGRLTAALRLVLGRYAAQVRRRPAVAIPALILPGVADALIFYAPPLVVARLLGAFARDERLSAVELAPYILTFAAVWLAGEAVWRVALLLMTRTEIRGMESLYIEAMDELLAKDLAFFHDNFAGSLTKRALGYARRFEDVFDVLCFSVSSNLIPLAFVGVVLWSYSPMLIVVLMTGLASTFAIVFPLIRRRRALVDVREAASNVVSGHVADSIANAEAVRAFAREPDEARIHSRNVRDLGTKTLRSWDYQTLRIDTITAPLHVLTNALGLIVAMAASEGTGASLEAVFITFTYYASATRVMWEFNRIYRNLESALTDAAQFTELLLDPPVVADAEPVEAFTPRDFSVELRDVAFRYSPGQPLQFDSRCANSAKHRPRRVCMFCHHAGPPLTNPEQFGPITWRHGTRLHARRAPSVPGVRAAACRRQRAVPGRARSLRDLSRAGRVAARGRGTAAVHRGGVRGVSRLWLARRRVCPVSVRGVRPGPARGVLVQRTGGVSELWRAPTPPQRAQSARWGPRDG